MNLRPGRLDYVAFNRTGSKANMAGLDNVEDQFHDSFTDVDQIEEAKQEELASLTAELESLELEENLVQMRLIVTAKKDRIGQLKHSASGYQYASSHTPNPPNRAVYPTDPTHANTLPTTKSLANDPGLAATLDMLKDAHLSEVLGGGDSNNCDDVRIPDHHNKGEHKPLYITDFVLDAKSSHRGKGDKDKLKTEDVSVDQWVSANARIMLAMLDDMDKETVRQYLSYTSKIGDYLQSGVVSQVMLFDERHRWQVACEGRRWDEIDGDTRYFFLEKDPNRNKQRWTGPQRKPRGPVDAQSNPICIRYNSQRGCSAPWCTYSHVCDVIGCGAPHPKHAHNSPPRFQGFRGATKQN